MIIDAEKQRQDKIEEAKELIKDQQTLDKWRELGVWDDNKSYDNWAHATGSQLTLIMPTARFSVFF